jgi:hypothetical protein
MQAARMLKYIKQQKHTPSKKVSFCGWSWTSIFHHLTVVPLIERLLELVIGILQTTGSIGVILMFVVAFMASSRIVMVFVCLCAA